MCTQAWELEIEDDGRWLEVLAWGVFTDKIVRHVGGDPARARAKRMKAYPLAKGFCRG